ncbi:Kelch-like protein 10 [Heterocephalus glaber]|uniref:Kelch-like protein 10 n=1 Tax=Heterocephalus glaber TaxID=10181 RepID=G5B0L6_HETGA|nr:Kelch-like protein 10 [Heterocephalus glaber]
MDMEGATTSSCFPQPHMERKMSAMTCEIFNELRLEGKLCDVVIKVNGFEFSAHKNILCSCSSYFRALFTSGWNNTEKKVYNIPGVSPDMMKLIIEYAYTRTVPITPDNVEKLLAAADQFNIMGIVRGCCEFLKSKLCLDNCIGICKLTDYYYCPELRQKAYMFILHNFEEMMKVSAEFLELSVTELRDIIEKDELNVKQEDAVFEAILKWISHDPQNRKQYISVLLPKVGGFDGINRLRSAEAYSPVANTWRTIPTMFNPRSNFGIEVVDDLLFVVGGFNGFTTTFNVECYDEKTEEWYDAHDMGIYRSALSCCVVPGLANVGEYTACREHLPGLAQRDEVKHSASTSTLPV